MGRKKKYNYSIEISYSWGDSEEPYGKFITSEDAYKEMCILSAKEAYVQNEEFLLDRTCSVYFDAYNRAIDLHYSDGTCCYYRVIEVN